MPWWDGDEAIIIASFLDGRSIALFARTCRVVRSRLRERSTLQWLADLRGLVKSAEISTIEHLELAGAMAKLSASISFAWGSMSIDASAGPSLQRIAQLLSKHSSLTLSIEAHCGLEARYHMPHPGQAKEYSRLRARAVQDALLEQAAESGIDTAELQQRIVCRAWGFSRPLVWAFNDGYGEQVDAEASARNRRVELYLRCGDYEIPKRRKNSEIPVPPGQPPLSDDDCESEMDFEEHIVAMAEAHDGDDDAVFTLSLNDGRTVQLGFEQLLSLGLYWE
jgi:outer membrane protein OmpA-like peptidoglycan-associated protein